MQFLLNEGIEQCKAEMLMYMIYEKGKTSLENDSIDALEKMKNHELAQELRHLYLEPQFTARHGWKLKIYLLLSNLDELFDTI